MPFLPEALASVTTQSYRQFELIVQDACSTDGSLHAIEAVEDIPSVSIVSEPDAGIGDAYNRALGRCRGEVIGTIDSDNLLAPDALENVVQIYEQNPAYAAVYGAANAIDEKGKILDRFQPMAFDPLRLLFCELVPPFASAFFFPKVCGSDLRFNPALETCADFDLWMRLSHLPILRSDVTFNATRLSGKSMSRKAELYEIFCRDKIAAVEDYLSRYDGKWRESLNKLAVAGIYLWAAESVYVLEGQSERMMEYCLRAEALEPQSSRLENLRRRIEIDNLRRQETQLLEHKAAVEQRLAAEEVRTRGLSLRLQLIESSRGWQWLEKYRNMRRRVKSLVVRRED